MDGIECQLLFSPLEFTASEYFSYWPLPDFGAQPTECQKGPPTTVRFEAGELSVEFALNRLRHKRER